MTAVKERESSPEQSFMHPVSSPVSSVNESPEQSDTNSIRKKFKKVGKSFARKKGTQHVLKSFENIKEKIKEPS